MKMSNYTRIEQLKITITKILKEAGTTKEDFNLLTEKDLEAICTIMISIESILKTIKKEEDKVNYMYKALLILLASLKISHNINIEEII